MGHYWGEMEDRAPDPYDYKAVREAGFEPTTVEAYGMTDVKRCPKCFLLVEGEFAMQHLKVAHSDSENQNEASP